MVDLASVLHVLHLEDNPLDAEIICRTVAEAAIPCAFHRVDSRDQFLAELNSTRFDAIVSDNCLPDIDGVEALALLRERGDVTPFVFLSGWSNNPDGVRRLQSLG